VDAAQYQADAHLPPKAHRPNGAADTIPMLRPTTDSERVETVREPRSNPARGSDLTTVPRGVPRGSKSATFVAALFVVLVVVGGATWFFMRARGDEPRDVDPSVSQVIAPPSTAAIATSASEPPTAGTLAPSSVPAPSSTPSALTKPAVEPSASATPPRAASTRPPVEPRPTAATSSSSRVAPPLTVEKPAPPPPVASPARPSASSRDDIPKDPL
jgi:cytoskeletal protein RodZ